MCANHAAEVKQRGPSALELIEQRRAQFGSFDSVQPARVIDVLEQHIVDRDRAMSSRVTACERLVQRSRPLQLARQIRGCAGGGDYVSLRFCTQRCETRYRRVRGRVKDALDAGSWPTVRVVRHVDHVPVLVRSARPRLRMRVKAHRPIGSSGGEMLWSRRD